MLLEKSQMEYLPHLKCVIIDNSSSIPSVLVCKGPDVVEGNVNAPEVCGRVAPNAVEEPNGCVAPVPNAGFGVVPNAGAAGVMPNAGAAGVVPNAGVAVVPNALVAVAPKAGVEVAPKAGC